MPMEDLSSVVARVITGQVRLIIFMPPGYSLVITRMLPRSRPQSAGRGIIAAVLRIDYVQSGERQRRKSAKGAFLRFFCFSTFEPLFLLLFLFLLL